MGAKQGLRTREGRMRVVIMILFTEKCSKTYHVLNSNCKRNATNTPSVHSDRP
ncbi:hypothetical protein J6590_093554 [Homalodisca vitripennis]|nr:hypothetical protein J6590_096832 [Homalodisca vitripennis]KAG8319356.1 hypothetical protein J6590_093554 [Homalodisca vitripennis]